LKLLFNSYILSIFNYAPILWMFCSKSLCKKVDTIHKRALRAVYQDFSKSYEDLLLFTRGSSLFPSLRSVQNPSKLKPLIYEITISSQARLLQFAQP